MATIPTTPDRSRMPGTPELRGGVGLVSPDDMGSANYRNWMRLGERINAGGQAQMQWAIGKYHEEAETEARVAFSTYSEEMAKQRNRITSIQGTEVTNAPKDLEEARRVYGENATKGLKTPLAKELFERRRRDFDSQNAVAVDGYMLREQERFKQTAIQADSEALINDAVLNAGNGQILAGNIQRIKANNEELYHGQPREFIENKNREMAAMTADRVAAAIAAADGPQAALGFLNSGIDVEIGDGALKAKFDALRKQYAIESVEAEQKAIVDAGTSQMIAMVRSGASPAEVYAQLVDLVGVEAAGKVAAGYKTYAEFAKAEAADKKEADKAATDAIKEEEKRAEEELTRQAISAGRAAGKDESKTQEQIRDEAYATFPEKQAKIYLDVAEAEEKAKKADEVAVAVNRTKTLDKEFREAGGVPMNMKSWIDGTMSLDEEERYLGIQRKRGGGNDQKKRVSIGKYLDYQALDDDQLLEAFRDPAKRDQIEEDLGGTENKYFGWVFSRIDPQAKKSGQSTKDADSVKGLNSDLNDIRRKTRVTMAQTGRDLNSEEMELAEDIVLEYANTRYDEEMAKAKVGKVEDLPMALRRQIQAEATLTFQEGGWGGQTITKAEAVVRGVDTSTFSVNTSTLPAGIKPNYIDGGTVYERPGKDGISLYEKDIPIRSVPDNVVTMWRRDGGEIQRDLTTGYWILSRPHGFVIFSKNGTDPKISDKKSGPATSPILPERSKTPVSGGGIDTDIGQ